MVAQQKRIQLVVGLIPGLTQWVKDQVLPGAVVQVADVARIWHCCSQCTPGAVAPIRPLAWELPYAIGAAPPAPKKRKKESYNNMKLEF